MSLSMRASSGCSQGHGGRGERPRRFADEHRVDLPGIEFRKREPVRKVGVKASEYDASTTCARLVDILLIDIDERVGQPGIAVGSQSVGDGRRD